MCDYIDALSILIFILYSAFYIVSQTSDYIECSTNEMSHYDWVLFEYIYTVVDID